MKKIWNADLLAYIQTSPNQAGTFLACFARFRVGIFLFAFFRETNPKPSHRRSGFNCLPPPFLMARSACCNSKSLTFLRNFHYSFHCSKLARISGFPSVCNVWPPLPCSGIPGHGRYSLYIAFTSFFSSGVRNVRSFLRSATSSPGPRLIWGIMFNCELDSSFRICIVRKSRSNRSWKLVEVYDCFLC